MQTAKPDTAKSYISTIRSIHNERGIPSTDFNDPRIDLVIRGENAHKVKEARKFAFHSTHNPLRNPPTTPRHRIRHQHQSSTCVAFAAFLRCGEFTWDIWSSTHHFSFLARHHVKFNSYGSVTLTLPSSKTDHNRTGVEIQLAPTSSQLRRVNALNELYSSFPRPRNDPLFSRTRSRPFTRQFVIQPIHRLLLQAGIPTRSFSGHSLRKGAAVTAAANGISRDEIKLLGWWKSDAVDVYNVGSRCHQKSRNQREGDWEAAIATT
jgi:hypothetical protein